MEEVFEDSDPEYSYNSREYKKKKKNKKKEIESSEDSLKCHSEKKYSGGRKEEKKEFNENIKEINQTIKEEKKEDKNDSNLYENCQLMVNESDEDDSNVFKQKKIENNELDKEEKFDFKKMILTQDILEGNWLLNPQTKLLIEENQKIYDKIKNYVEKFNIQNKKEEIIITILVLYCLKHNNQIEQLDYIIIMNKGLAFLESIGIKEILYQNIESNLV